MLHALERQNVPKDMLYSVFSCMAVSSRGLVSSGVLWCPLCPLCLLCPLTSAIWGLFVLLQLARICRPVSRPSLATFRVCQDTKHLFNSCPCVVLAASPRPVRNLVCSSRECIPMLRCWGEGRAGRGEARCVFLCVSLWGSSSSSSSSSQRD